AVALVNRIGSTFDAVVTGVTPNGTFVRILNPPAEGRLARGAQGADVGDRFPVKLLSTDPRRGYIDFGRYPASSIMFTGIKRTAFLTLLPAMRLMAQVRAQNPARIEMGHKLFQKNCSACHG